MKLHCHKCGGLIGIGLHWGMFVVTYCKRCKRMCWGWGR
jgi:hypothetical protein